MWRAATVILVLALAAHEARAVTVGDVTRVEGQRINKLHGLGLVVGLPGTGDSGDYAPAIRPLAALLQRLADPVASPTELKATKNVALVFISVTVPASGARTGDKLDVEVQSAGNAKSLAGGRLFMTPLQGPQKNSIVYGLAEGSVRIENTKMPTVGVVDGGAVIETEILTEFVSGNKFRLVLADALSGFAAAAEVAQVINERNQYTAGHDIARALDARTVEVLVPEFQRANPVPFLGDIQKLSLRSPLETAARVEINDHTGTIVITGNVEISAAVISHPTLTLSTVSMTSSASAATNTLGAGGSASASSGPAPAPEGPFAKIDPSGEGGVRLQDLVNAMNTLKVPSPDQIAIIKLLSKGGRIHGEVIFVE
jgi:flagellar P-ring protein precursor FlgI